MKIPVFILTSLLSATLVFSQTGNSAAKITRPKLIPTEKTILYKLGDKNIPIKIYQYGDVKDMVYVNVHDSEPTSVQAAKLILEILGGTLIRIDNSHQRNIRFKIKNITYTIDPNRIFSRTGIIQTLKNSGYISPEAIDETDKFAQRILQLIPDTTSCIIALHNNTNGSFSVRSYLPGIGDRQFDARAVFADSLQDIDDIAFTTDSLLYQKMADEHYNTIWQDNEKAKKDGSLSVYCGERNRRYMNIETEHGKLNQHIQMLERLLGILLQSDKRYLNKMEDLHTLVSQ
jgi:hypothetical protein